MPEDARAKARLGQYGNREDEKETIHRVDQQIFDTVRVFERHLIEQADALDGRRTELIAEATAISDELSLLTREVTRKKVPFDANTARRHQILAQRADETADELERLNGDVNHVAEKLSDPYAAYEQLLDRFPLLRPEIQFN